MSCDQKESLHSYNTFNEYDRLDSPVPLLVGQRVAGGPAPPSSSGSTGRLSFKRTNITQLTPQIFVSTNQVVWIGHFINVHFSVVQLAEAPVVQTETANFIIPSTLTKVAQTRLTLSIHTFHNKSLKCIHCNCLPEGVRALIKYLTVVELRQSVRRW